jgi:hypothetical protein
VRRGRRRRVARGSPPLAAAALAALVALAAAPPAGAAEIVLDRTAGYERAYPLRGEPARVTVRGDDGAPLAGAVVETLYRPNSQTTHAAWLAPTDAAGTTTWTPEDAGIVALIAHQGAADGPVLASLDVTVRFGGFPASGLAVMIVAGLILFGGAAVGFVRLLGPGGEPPAAEPPST